MRGRLQDGVAKIGNFSQVRGNFQEELGFFGEFSFRKICWESFEIFETGLGFSAKLEVF